MDEGLLTSGIDGISVHPYESGKPEDLFISRYTLVRNILRNGGAPNMPILGSEVGFSEGTFTGRGFTAIEARDLQACYFVRQNIVDRMCGILMTNWYDLKEETSFSMLKSDNSPQPALNACETLITELSGYSFKDEIILSDATDYAALFENPSGAQKIVAWTTQDTTPHSATIRVGSPGAKTIVDIDGDTSTLTANASGDLTLTLSRSPQYIRLTTPLPGTVKTIVDNTDGSPATAIQGTWTAYNGSVLVTDGGFYGANFVLDGATGTGKYVSLIPSLPFAGQYDIYVRWNAASTRASNAKYIVSSNEGTQTYLMDQKVNGGRWRYLATRSFSAGRNASRYVRISNDGSIGSVCADAVMFVATAPTGATTRDASGNVYLGSDHVPYDASQDGSGSGPSSIAISADKRSATLTGNTWKAFPLPYTVTPNTVLEVTVNGTNLAEISGIALDNNTSPVSGKRAFLFGGGAQSWGWAVSPPYTAGSGPVTFVIQAGAFFTGSVTHLGFIGDDDAAPYTLNVTYSSIRIYEAIAQEVILDNNAASVTYVGSWPASTSNPGYLGTNYQHDGNTPSELKTATYSPSFVVGGAYELYVYYSAASNRASNAQVLVNHQGGQAILTVNQRLNGGQWNYLGTYTFAQTGGSVVVKNKLPSGAALDGFTIADGFKFTPAP